jgi:hypothetical protein
MTTAVEHVKRSVRDGSSDGSVDAFRFRLQTTPNLVDAAADDCLGWTILVENASARSPATGDLRRQSFAADYYCTAPVVGLRHAAPRREQLEMRGSKFDKVVTAPCGERFN